MSGTVCSIIIKKEEFQNKHKYMEDINYMIIQPNLSSQWAMMLFENASYTINDVLYHIKELKQSLIFIFDEDNGWSISGYKNGILRYSYGLNILNNYFEETIYPNDDSFKDRITEIHSYEFYELFNDYTKKNKKNKKEVIEGISIIENELKLEKLLEYTYEYIKKSNFKNISVLFLSEQKNDGILSIIKKNVKKKLENTGFKMFIDKPVYGEISFFRKMFGFNVGMRIQKDDNILVPIVVTIYDTQFLRNIAGQKELYYYSYNIDNLESIIVSIYDDFLTYGIKYINSFKFNEFDFNIIIREVDEIMNQYSFKRKSMSKNILVGGSIVYIYKDVVITLLNNPFRIAVACQITKNGCVKYIDVNNSISEFSNYFIYHDSFEFIELIKKFIIIINDNL